nr:uncharacterized protein LOC109164833 [Ipomoea batatas]
MGDGHSIRVWDDPWLPQLDSSYIQTIMPSQLSGIKVEALLNAEKTNWDLDIIHAIFDSEDRDAILSIPVPQTKHPDKFIWAGEEKGVYTIKSCYKLLVRGLISGVSLDWANMWKLSIPPKVKLFVWQACTSTLPTTDMLAKKRVNCSTLCILCGKDSETTSHRFTECDFAITCWATITGIYSSTNLSFAEWVAGNMKSLDQPTFCLVLITCWKI